MNSFKFTLVGAGPGNPELLTIKGHKALINAGALLYDALVSPELVNLAPEGIPKIFVGKRKGKKEFSQEEINELIIHYAFSHHHVVRLKGGDPFVFGRGFEELRYAESFNISTEYIPGISSSISVAGLSGIPVTHRGTSESFWVITATNLHTDLSSDINIAAQTNATIVVLMGLSKLKEIVEVFKFYKRHSTAIAIIQNGSLSDQKIVTGTIENIFELSQTANIGTPAIIIIGDVVKLHSSYDEWKIKLSQVI